MLSYDSVWALALLDGIELVNGLEKCHEVDGQSNSHAHMEYLVRVTPTVECARFPRLGYAQLFVGALARLHPREGRWNTNSVDSH